jgi:hypothetical protein
MTLTDNPDKDLPLIREVKDGDQMVFTTLGHPGTVTQSG